MFAGLRKKWRDQIGQTKTILGEKVREALASVVPITLIVLILCFTAAPVPTDVLLAFLVGAVLLIVVWACLLWVRIPPCSPLVSGWAHR